MGRKLKGHEERRNEILDGAWELFTTRGYERGTVAAIIDRVGISKGTFYHYFSSKEEVLDAIADRLAREPLDELRPIVEDAALEARPKLEKFLEVSRQSRLRRFGSTLGVARVLHTDENLVIRHKLTERLNALVMPLLRAIFEQGVAEGVFQVSDAGEAALFFLKMANTLADQQMQTLLEDRPAEDKVPDMVRRANFVSESLERVLGAEPGTIPRPSPQMLELFARAVDAERESTGAT